MVKGLEIDKIIRNILYRLKIVKINFHINKILFQEGYFIEIHTSVWFEVETC